MQAKLKKYKKVRSLIQSGDLIEFGSNSILGKTIRRFTKRDVNHTAVAICSGILPRRVFLLEALGRGLTPNFLSERIAAFDGRIYWIPLQSKYDDRRVDMARWMIQEFVVRKPEYDFGGLIRNAWSRVPIDGSKYYCSEFAHWAWAQYRIIPKSKKAARPGEFEAFGVTMPRVCLL